MSGFHTLTAAGFSLPDDDIDTDVIFPARFLLHTEKKGLGRFAFHNRPTIRAAYDAAQRPAIFIAGANFGCGSSREHAVWALSDMGVGVLFAASFGEIFRGNCTNNGIVAGTLDVVALDTLHRIARDDAELTVDLVACRIDGAGETLAFDIGASDRAMLLAGWNPTTRMLALHGTDIALFEDRQRAAAPWLWTQEA